MDSIDALNLKTARSSRDRFVVKGSCAHPHQRLVKSNSSEIGAQRVSCDLARLKIKPLSGRGNLSGFRHDREAVIQVLASM